MDAGDGVRGGWNLSHVTLEEGKVHPGPVASS